MRQVMLVLALLIGAFARVPRPPRSPIAVVTDVHGAIQLERATAARGRSLTYTAILRAGDRLALRRTSRVTLFQLNAPVQAISGPQTLTVHPVRPSSRPDRLSSDLFGLMIQQLADAARHVDERSTRVQRGTGGVTVTALEPRYNRVMDFPLTFRWTAVKDADRYQVSLFDSKERQLWQITTTKAQITYPADAPPLAAGQYSWEVIAEAGGHDAGDSAPFSISSPQDAETARRALDQASHLVPQQNVANLPYLAICLQYRIYPRAEAFLRAVRQRDPGDGVLIELLMRVQQLTHQDRERENTRGILATSRRGILATSKRKPAP